MSSTTSKLLHSIYYDTKNEASFGGALKLLRKAQRIDPNIRLSTVKEWLKSQDTYTLFRQPRKKFRRLQTVQGEVDKQWQGDLMDMSWIEKENNGFRYIFVLIDVLSRFAHVVALKNKSADSIVAAFKSVISRGRKPKKLQTDQGREFKNSKFQSFLRDHNILFFTTTDENIKCALAERFNRTLREKIYKYLHSSNTLKYIHVLSDIVASYNNTVHSRLKMRPNEVSTSNQEVAFKNLYGTKEPRKRKMKTLPVGALVRIARVKNTFEKGATSNYTQERFRVKEVITKNFKPVYKLEDEEGEVITSIFYPEEVVEVVKSDSPEHIEKVLRTRKKNGVKEYFVKWLGYPSKFNSWVTTITKI